MFEAAELMSSLDKRAYERELPRLRAALLEAQRQLAGSKHSCLIIVGGDAAAGKGSLVDTLLAWMDARGILVHTFPCRSRARRESIRQRAAIGRRCRPPGTPRSFSGAGIRGSLSDRAYGRINDADLESAAPADRRAGADARLRGRDRLQDLAAPLAQGAEAEHRGDEEGPARARAP